MNYLNLVGESSRSEASSDRSRPGVGGKLEHSSLAHGSRWNYEHFTRVFNGNDGSCSQEQLLPSTTQVDDMDTLDKLKHDVRWKQLF